MDFEHGVDTKYFDALGNKLYGEQWPNVRAHNIRRLKGGDQSPLPQAELNKLVNGLEKLDEFRRK